MGIGLIVLGGYILHYNKAQSGLLAPFAAFAHEKGSWFMLIVATLFAFAAVIGKKAMLHSSPLFFSFSFFLVFNATVLTGLLISRKTDWQRIFKNSRKGMWLGFLLLVHISFHALAISISTAVYMVAVKRSSILFSVLLSWLILKESDIRYRGIGTLFMFAGMILITLLGWPAPFGEISTSQITRKKFFLLHCKKKITLKIPPCMGLLKIYSTHNIWWCLFLWHTSSFILYFQFLNNSRVGSTLWRAIIFYFFIIFPNNYFGFWFNFTNSKHLKHRVNTPNAL